MLLFDYDKAMYLVKELRQIAVYIDDLKASLLTNAIIIAQRGWEGQTADLFLKKCDSLKNLITSESNQITTIANSLESTAKIIDRAESTAKNILKLGLLS